MNWIFFFATALAATIAVAPCAYAQSDAASTPTADSSSLAPATVSNRKETKAADRTLARAVRSAIEHVKGLDATRIAIVARNGNVTLDGSVPEGAQVDLAIQRAKSVAGVATVVNRLNVGEIAP